MLVEENEEQDGTGTTGTDMESTPASFSIKKRFLVFGLVCWLIIISFSPKTIANAFLPIYNEAHNVSVAWTGRIMSGPNFSLILVCLISPLFIHKVSTRRLLMGCMIFESLALLAVSLLHYTSDSPVYKYLALVGFLAIGLAGGFVEVTSFVTLTSLFPHNISVATALGELTINIALALGPFIGGFLYTELGYTLAFLVPGVVIVVSLVVAWRVPQVITVSEREGGGLSTRELLGKVIHPGVLFPAWHSATCQILLQFPTPLLSLYVEDQFGKGVVWSGSVLLAETACLALLAPLWGRLIDKFSPFPAMVFSSIAIPAIYIFVGPCPPLAPSKGQLFATLCLLGAALPSGTLSCLTAMREAYRLRHGIPTTADLSPQVASALVAVYCASFPFGGFLGFTVGGIVGQYLSFPRATSILAGVYLIESAACLVYCGAFRVIKAKRSGQETGDGGQGK